VVLQHSTLPSRRLSQATIGTSARCAVREVTQGLLKLGLLKGKLQNLIKEGAYKQFFCIALPLAGHDVHDVGDYKVGNEWRVLEPGMALTVDPVLYSGGSKGVINVGGTLAFALKTMWSSLRAVAKC